MVGKFFFQWKFHCVRQIKSLWFEGKKIKNPVQKVKKKLRKEKSNDDKKFFKLKEKSLFLLCLSVKLTLQSTSFVDYQRNMMLIRLISIWVPHPHGKSLRSFSKNWLENWKLLLKFFCYIRVQKKPTKLIMKTVFEVRAKCDDVDTLDRFVMNDHKIQRKISVIPLLWSFRVKYE